MNKSSIILILIAILVSLGIGTFAYKIVDELVSTVGRFVTDVSNIDNVDALDEFDDFEYSAIFMVGAQSYEPTADNVLNFYSKIVNAGYSDENYNYLGFYRAYMEVKDDRLDIMDHMLNLVQDKAYGQSKYRDFYFEIAGNTCYLDFVFDRLETMGFEDIKEEKYRKVLSAYEDAMFDYDGEPFKKLSDKEQKIVQEIMEKYREYSKKYEAELGQKIKDNKSNSITCETPNKGGRV